MKLQNEVFFNENFISGFKRLLNFDFDSTDTLGLIKSVKILDEQQYAVFLTRDKLIKQYGKLKENGEIVKKDGNIQFNSDENKQKFEKEFLALLRDEFEIPLKNKIKLTKNHKINGNQLSALIDNVVEVVDNGGK